MKLQLDTTNKIIKIEETVNLGDLIEQLEKLLPKNEWRKFSLQTNISIDWSTPIIITPYKPYPIPWYQQPWITCDANNSSEFTLSSGVYNIEI